MADTSTRDTLGMTHEELSEYFDELLMQEAIEAAAQNKSTVEEELNAPGFLSVRAAASYFIPLIAANNAFIARALLDRGVLPVAPAAADAAE